MYAKERNWLVVFVLLTGPLLCFAQYSVRPIEDLTAPGDTGWLPVAEWVKTATNKVEILPRDDDKASNTLYHVQVTTRSVMGAVIYITGGILVDHGWIHILGSGSKRMNRNVSDWNQGKTFKQYGEHTPYYLVADDVLGGFFAINGGALGPDVGKIYYLSPDNLKWAPTNYTYSEFLRFCFYGDLDKFYQGFRWDGWQAELDTLSGDMGYTFFPFLWSKDGGDIRNDHRSAVPMQQLYVATMVARKQLGLEPQTIH